MLARHAAARVGRAGVDCSKIDGCRTLLGARQQTAPTRSGRSREGRFSLSAAPSGQVDRRLMGLGKANEVRVARARLKQRLRDGNAQIEQILIRPPAYVSTAEVLDLLLAVPKIGPARAHRLLASARVGHTKAVGGLSERQRTQLIDLLRTRTKR
jgi:hypothetical protein